MGIIGTQYRAAINGRWDLTTAAAEFFGRLEGPGPKPISAAYRAEVNRGNDLTGAAARAIRKFPGGGPVADRFEQRVNARWDWPLSAMGAAIDELEAIL